MALGGGVGGQGGNLSYKFCSFLKANLEIIVFLKHCERKSECLFGPGKLLRSSVNREWFKCGVNPSELAGCRDAAVFPSLRRPAYQFLKLNKKIFFFKYVKFRQNL